MRTFGFVMLVGCGAIAVLAYLRRHEASWPVWAVSGVGASVFLWSLVSPTTVTPIYRAWMGLGRSLGTLSSAILLSIVYFLVVTPVGVAMRLFGSDPLDRRRTTESSWRARTVLTERSDYERMV